MDFLKENKKLVRWGLISLAGVLVAGYITYVIVSFMKKDLFLDSPQLVSKGDAFVTLVKGDAYYRSSLNSFSAWKQLIVGDRLESSFMIRTRDEAEVHINFSGKSLVSIKEQSFLIVKEFTAETLLLDFRKGAMIGKFNKLYDSQPLMLKTPTSHATVIKDTSMMVELFPKKKRGKVKKTKFSLISGVIEVTGTKPEFTKKVYVSSKEQLTVRKNHMKRTKKLSKKELGKLNILVDDIREAEEYLITASIQFEANSYEIDIDSFFELDKVYRVLKKKSNLNIKIKGHADSEGKEVYNDALSVKRAMAIREYFIENGVDRGRFRIKGYGENQPVAPNSTKKGRSLNRRVEFSISLE